MTDHVTSDESTASDEARQVAQAGNGSVPPEAAAELVRVLQGVLTGVQGVVGEGASQALLRYGAFEEGKRLATKRGQPQLDGMMMHVDRLFGQTSTAERLREGTVRVELYGSPVVGAENPLIDTILLGLYEGLLNGLFQARFKGAVMQRQGGDATLTFVISGN